MSTNLIAGPQTKKPVTKGIETHADRFGRFPR